MRKKDRKWGDKKKGGLREGGEGCFRRDTNLCSVSTNYCPQLHRSSSLFFISVINLLYFPFYGRGGFIALLLIVFASSLFLLFYAFTYYFFVFYSVCLLLPFFFVCQETLIIFAFCIFSSFSVFTYHFLLYCFFFLLPRNAGDLSLYCLSCIFFCIHSLFFLSFILFFLFSLLICPSCFFSVFTHNLSLVYAFSFLYQEAL